MRQLAGVLLTGGASRRMGTDKARLVVDGETLAARSARVLAAVCEPVIEVGPGVSGLPAVEEEPRHAAFRGCHYTINSDRGDSRNAVYSRVWLTAHFNSWRPS